jgi:YD repeat-containing protein
MDVCGSCDPGLGYDAENRRTATTDATGSVTSYQYDAVGRLVGTTYPDAPTTGTTYD